MVAFMDSHPEMLPDLISLAVANEKLSPRAAWLLSNCILDRDARLDSRKREILRSLKEKTGGHQRDLVRVLSKLNLDDVEEGLFFEHCVQLWSDPGNLPSVRHVSMRALMQMSTKYPELYNEVDKLLSDKYLGTLSPGLRRSILRLKKETENKLS